MTSLIRSAAMVSVCALMACTTVVKPITPQVTAPTLSVQPLATTVTAGQSATFTVQAEGTAPLTYQWRRDGEDVPEATSPGYSTTATGLADTGARFSVVVSNSAGSVTSDEVTLTVTPGVVATAPLITEQPTAQMVTVGDPATFRVAAQSDTQVSHQWRKNGAAIAGATRDTYTTPATSLGESGALFSVVVSNAVGSATSNSALLTVTATAVAPVIVTQPADAIVAPGDPVTFNVVATGTAPLSYQWQRDLADLPGQTSATFILSSTALADSGAKFTVRVSNLAGDVVSAEATLTVQAPPVAPTIAVQPANATVNAGEPASFSVVANGTSPLSYQWRRGTAAIPGATSATYVTLPTATNDTGALFSVVVSNAAGSLASTTALLLVNAVAVAPVITTQPASRTVTVGQTATFAVTASGTAPLSYQWRKNGADLPSATASSFTTPVTTAADNGATFSVVVSNAAGTTSSANATLTVNPLIVPPTITSQPANVTVTVGQVATFMVTASGTAPLSYQWQKNGAAIAGATGATYGTPATAAGDSGAVFAVTVTNAGGTATSGNATLTVTVVSAVPTITSQPANTSVAVGQVALFSVTAAGAPPLSYQWSRGGVAISGATQASYTTPVAAALDSGSVFSVVVTNGSGSVTSTNATLTVTTGVTPPFISMHPSSTTVTVGQTATFSVTATGTAPLNTQWRRNGVAIAGATAATFTTAAAVAGDNGALFSAVVSNASGSATSTNAVLAVTATSQPPTITTQPRDVTVGSGQVPTFSVSVIGTAPLSYQWRRGGAPIVGATSATYSPGAVAASDTGASFSVVITNPVSTVTSTAAVLTVTPDPVWQQTNGPRSITVTALASSGALMFAGSSDGVYRSLDNGANWSEASPGLGDKRDISSVVFAGTRLYLSAKNTASQRATFTSIDSGATWTQVRSNGGLLAWNGTAILSASAQGSDVARSLDHGVTWTTTSTGVVDSIAAVGSTFYRCGKLSGGVFQSTDNGATWSAFNTGLTQNYQNRGYYFTQALFAAGGALFMEQTLNVSPNSSVVGNLFRLDGSSWVPARTGLPVDYWNNAVQGITTIGADLFAVVNTGEVFRSTNMGTSWTSVGTGLGDGGQRPTRALVSSGTHLFAAAPTGLLRSVDNGASWFQLEVGGISGTVLRLKTFGSKVVAVSGDGLFRTADNGTSWSRFPTLPQGSLWDMFASSTHLFTGSGNGMPARSADDGVTWTTLTAPLALNRGVAIGNNVLVSGGQYVSRSADNGATWSALQRLSTSNSVTDLVVSGSRMLASLDGGGQILYSDDNGATWTTGTGAPSVQVFDLFVDGSTLYAACSGGRVLRSTNNGGAWSEVAGPVTGVFANATAMVAVSNTLVVATNRGVYRFIIGGAGWTDLNAGLGPTPDVPSLAIIGTELFCGKTNAGVWRRPL